MRPERPLRTALEEAFAKGLKSAAQNWTAMVALLAAMGAVVLIYYTWPTGAAVLSWYAAWQHAGGLVRAGLAAGCAGGVISELSLVVLRDRGRFSLTHLENMAFRFTVFFFGGMVVSEFYVYQAIWFGDGTSWRVLLPKVLVDQFIYSVFWSTTYQSLTFRWQVLRYSVPRLWSELNGTFVIERMLPVLVTNWMFWIPGATLVYSMPLFLQAPLSFFATAMWSILLAGLARPAGVPDTDMVPGPILTPHDPVNDLAE